MLKQVEVISEDLRRKLNEDLENHFKVEQGSDLDSVVREVLNDRTLFTYLSAFLPKGKGIILGSAKYWDDITVYVHYGLTLDFNLPRKLKLFRFKSLYEVPSILCGKDSDFSLIECFPDFCRGGRIENYSSPEDFCNTLERVLMDSKRQLIDLPMNDKTRKLYGH